MDLPQVEPTISYCHSEYNKLKPVAADSLVSHDFLAAIAGPQESGTRVAPSTNAVGVVHQLSDRLQLKSKSPAPS